MTPMRKDELKKLKAYQEGWEACEERVGILKVPYPRNSTSWEAWREGYVDCVREKVKQKAYGI